MHPILEEMDQSLPEGEIPAAIFNDQDIFELKRERNFARSWAYLAHESEIPNPGDYVLRYIVDDPLIVVRDWEKQIRALLDACRHRGMQVCRSEMGNASHFRCPYHGWTYRKDGALIFIVDMRREYLYRLGAGRTIHRSAVKLAGQGADSEKTTGPEGKKLGRGFERALV